MARLNEAPAPAESVEALKRRFLRQNRELAKTNSSQSLRISALETETSRLLAENVALREDIIHLQSQVEESQSVSPASFAEIKDNLVSKIGELNALVTDLGKLQRGPRGKRVSTGVAEPSEQRSQLTRPPRLDIGADQEGRLPAIDENTCYPRQSIGPLDVAGLRLSDQTNESPDIGPPPVAHFECDDPIRFEPRRNQIEQPNESDVDGISVALPPNLETRRKRRESNTRFDSKRIHVFDSSSPKDHTDRQLGTVALDSQNTKPTLKAGAKRKLSVRDETGSMDEAGPRPTEDFYYSRKISSESESLTADHDVSPKTVDKIEKRGELRQSGSGDRRVLGSSEYQSTVSDEEFLTVYVESANVSPRKSATVTANDKLKERTKTTQPKLLDPETEATSESLSAAPSQGDTNPTNISIPPPKTPAATELLSPTSNAASTARADSRDTPPPGDLGSTTVPKHGDGAAARTARRARAQVSYAEPSLVSKMRRPNKDLTDAVASRERQQRNSKTGPGDKHNKSIEEKTKMRTVVVKKEDSCMDWKRLSATANITISSPLGQKSSNAQEPAEPLAMRNSPGELSFGGETLPKDTATSALTAASRRRRDRTAGDNTYVSDAIGEMESLNIYDLNESSPANSAGVSTAPEATTDAALELTRRVSSMRDGPNRSLSGKCASSKAEAAGVVQDSKSSSLRKATEIMAGHKALEKAGRLEGLEKEMPERIEVGRSMRAARRRSMML
ncbi:MAG: hypothetical protein Q9165_004756 [Trypethelium subeluteriae]